MTVIWKFPFYVADVVDLDMPAGARVLHAGAQGGVPCLWALVDDSAPLERRRFAIIGTGRPVVALDFLGRLVPAGSLEHVATFQAPPFVWHVFEARA